MQLDLCFTVRVGKARTHNARSVLSDTRADTSKGHTMTDTKNMDDKSLAALLASLGMVESVGKGYDPFIAEMFESLNNEDSTRILVVSSDLDDATLAALAATDDVVSGDTVVTVAPYNSDDFKSFRTKVARCTSASEHHNKRTYSDTARVGKLHGTGASFIITR